MVKAQSGDHPLVDNLTGLDDTASDKLDSTKFQATINSADATTPVAIKAGEADKKIYILGFIISTDTEANFILQDNTGTPVVLIKPIYMSANSSMGGAFHMQTPLVVPTAKDLDILASAAGNVSVTVTGYIK